MHLPCLSFKQRCCFQPVCGKCIITNRYSREHGGRAVCGTERYSRGHGGRAVCGTERYSLGILWMGASCGMERYSLIDI